MTSDRPESGPDAPASAAELPTANEFPATTAGPAASDPKLPPFRGD
jgi:hypothetical protein